MKIFSWMQKRLAPNVLKDGVLARNTKKTESIAIDSNTKSLLEEVTFVDVLDGWKDGILTIGTFGFDPLTPLTNKETDYSVSETEEIEIEIEVCEENQKSEDEEEEEEIAPLMFNISDIGSDSDAITVVDEAPLTPLADEFSVSNEISVDPSETEDGKLRRKTLAELFEEDNDVKTKKIPSGKKLSEKKKGGGLSFAKKLIPLVGDQDSISVKKIQKVMKKMLKRKIHPAIESKSPKSSYVNKLGASENDVESISLLQISDGAVQASF